MGPMRRLLLTLIGAGLLVTACAASSEPTPVVSNPASTPGHHRPAPRRTTTLPAQKVYPIGQVITVRDPGIGAVVRLTARGPSVSTQRLSPNYGYPPQNGYYLTFHLLIVDAGASAVDVNPESFLVDVPGMSGVDSYSGNAKYSGEATQLDSTFLNPGESVSGDLTFDVSHVHGMLRWVVSGATVCAWRF
jgi:hypothetical protein